MKDDPPTAPSESLVLNRLGYFEKRGLNVLVFSNSYSSQFSDSKISGVEMIHHGVRTVTNGDIRLGPTPGQWDPIPVFNKRELRPDQNAIDVYGSYPDYEFDFMIRVEGNKDGVTLSVHLERPLPTRLRGRAGFNLELLPSAYCEKAYFVDDASGVFPLYPGGPVTIEAEPLPLAAGRSMVFAPEVPERRIRIDAEDGELLLYDGRNTAQNGWFVVRSLLPADRTGEVMRWRLHANTIAGWTRTPVIAHSQLGYHPSQRKVAVIELDPNDTATHRGRVLRITPSGWHTEVYSNLLSDWGTYTRYHYLLFDFTEVSQPGLYVIEFGIQSSKPFRIDDTVYDDAWTPTLDVFFPVQMDHVLVREAYRVWHGLPHMDDAVQAPVNHVHFDLYAQGPTTDTPFQPGEHIPGLNVGGWFDAGDYDIRTQTQYAVVTSMAHTWEDFHVDRDQTHIDQRSRYVEIHRPDGRPDLLQQIEHGVLALIAQYRAVGHAIPGIIVPNLRQYTHLGDASTETDNVSAASVHTVRADRDGFHNSDADDRWAFTNRTSALTYGSIAALAAASRALSDSSAELAAECLDTARSAWDEEQAEGPFLFRHGNTTGGDLAKEEFSAALELLICTGEQGYAERIEALWPETDGRFEAMGALAVRAAPFMGAEYRARLRRRVAAYRSELEELESQNPYGVPISTGGWAGNGRVIAWAITNYLLHTAFPDLIEAEYTLTGLNYILGCHPDSNISFVSGVGVHSKKVAYGTNRADFTYIAGGVAPGVLIIQPDFPENKEDWPFLWGENEYVVNVAADYVYLVHAARMLLPSVRQ